MNQKINKELDSTLENITKLIFNSLKKNDEIPQQDILNLVYSSLSNIYSLISNDLKEMYSKVAEFNINQISDLTYQKDGKTLEERITNHIDYIKDNKDNEQLIKNYAIQSFDTLLHTESMYLKNKLMYNKIRPVASVLIIEAGNDCAEYGGEFPADEDVPLPPYHPNCQCVSYYIEETDNEDDIKDLDLEVEE